MSDEHRRPFGGHGVGIDRTTTTVLGLAGLAWVALAGLAASPWSLDFEHSALEHIGAHPWVLGTLAIGWVLMVAAMMLPTSLLLFSLFAGLVGDRADRRELLGLLLGVYMLAWLAAGTGMHAADLGIHQLVDRWDWLSHRTWAIEAGTLTLAGAYQFSALKHRCARRCRMPQSFLRTHWHGVSARGETLRLAADHAASCIGCCWALMLVMFSVGVASFPLMLALTVAMVAEKTPDLGRRISTPLGAWLLGAALLTVIAR
jgi:predicted metal-binding membrane protein